MELRKNRTHVQSVNSRIATRVQSLRKDLHLSLDALALKSGVSRSMISLIERGESSPTAVVLEKMAAALNVPLATLFEDTAAPASPISQRDDRISWRDPESGYVRRNISPPGFASPIRIVEVVLPGGARVAYESGAREIRIHQQIWVRQGNLEITVGKTKYSLAKDDCLAMQLNESTTFVNRSRQRVRYIVVTTTESPRPSRK